MNDNSTDPLTQWIADTGQTTPSDYTQWVRDSEWRHFRDIITEATRQYWQRRAREFAAVGTPRCDEIAQACRNAAELAPLLAPGTPPEGQH